MSAHGAPLLSLPLVWILRWELGLELRKVAFAYLHAEWGQAHTAPVSMVGLRQQSWGKPSQRSWRVACKWHRARRIQGHGSIQQCDLFLCHTMISAYTPQFLSLLFHNCIFACCWMLHFSKTLGNFQYCSLWGGGKNSRPLGMSKMAPRTAVLHNRHPPNLYPFTVT